VTRVGEQQSYPEHPERFEDQYQVLCREALTGRCYWEVEWEGNVDIGVTYRGISRRGEGDDSCLGMNDRSWSLDCFDDDDDVSGGVGRYIALYNSICTDIDLPPPHSNRVGVYVDRIAGTLSFYRVSPDVGLTHIHTFKSTFTMEDLLPAFELRIEGSSVSLCQL